MLGRRETGRKLVILSEDEPVIGVAWRVSPTSLPDCYRAPLHCERMREGLLTSQEAQAGMIIDRKMGIDGGAVNVKRKDVRKVVQYGITLLVWPRYASPPDAWPQSFNRLGIN